MFPKSNFLQRLLKLEPLLTRGAIVGAVGVAGMLFNHHFADGTVQHVGDIVLSGFGFLTAIVGRPAVTPNVKVNTYSPDPYGNPDATKAQLDGRY